MGIRNKYNMKNRLSNFLIVNFILVLFGGVGYSHRETLLDYYKTVTRASSTLIEGGKNKYFYAPWKAIDGNIKTAWVEGKKDQGINEFISIHIGLISKNITALEIMPGLAANKKLFKMNNRPKDIQIVIYKEYDLFDSKYPMKKGKIYQEYKTYNYELMDKMNYQKFDLPGIEAVFFRIRGRTKLKIIIKSVYKGTKYNDTCISEIKLIESDGRDATKVARDIAIETEKRTKDHQTPR